MTKVEEDVNEDHTENKKISKKKDEEQVEKEENIEKIEKKDWSPQSKGRFGR